jgi:hypothetical protein
MLSVEDLQKYIFVDFEPTIIANTDVLTGFFLYYIYITPVNNLPLDARKPQRFTNIYNEQFN